MSIKPDTWIRKMSLEKGLVDPFVEHTSKNRYGEKLISYGVSSYGYDIRLSGQFFIFTNLRSKIVDPKNFSEDVFTKYLGDYCIIPPNSFALASSIEYIKMPHNVMGIVLGKSTYARCGIVTNFTPLEAGWEGHITIEISNTTPLPAKIYANEGIAQILFFESEEDCEISYADRDGKYNKQVGITLAKV